MAVKFPVLFRHGMRLAFGTALLASALLAPAQPFPAKAVRIIVPYPAGGLGDILPRALGASLTEQLGQQFIIE